MQSMRIADRGGTAPFCLGAAQLEAGDSCPVRPGLEIRVVLWPQSTKTSVGPPDSARWWSGGVLENSP